MFVKNRRRVEVIHRHVEKSLNLLRVQVHRQHAIRAGRGQHVRNQLRRDRHPRLVFAVLPRVAEKRNHRRDPRCAGPPRRVNQDQQFHDVLICRRAGALDDINIPAADVLVDLHHRLPVGERTHGGIAERQTAILGDGLCERPV